MKDRVEKWLARDPDPQTREELQTLLEQDDADALQSRFAGRLAFGTAGLRGPLGAGPMRMNRLVVQETTAGLGAVLEQEVPDAKSRGVVVGYDARRNSDVFATDAATVLAAMGFKVWRFDTCVPTPAAAFAVRHLGAAAGIVVTASHNPPQDNGYKVYWDRGAQIIPPIDAKIAAAIETVSTQPIPWTDTPTIEILGDSLKADYLVGVAALCPNQSANAELKIAYTPMHGVGAELTTRALENAGFKDVEVESSQATPDGSFPTVAFPNPEEPGAMDRVIALAKKCDADLACAQDPDADRLAVAYRNEAGDYVMLTGNQIGILLGAYLLDRAPANATLATTVVSSRMLSRIAQSHGAHFFETLTGFKWIANGGLDQEAAGKEFIFGYEEALGYTVGGLVRCKDGVSALVTFCTLAAELKTQGSGIEERLEHLYRTHGLFLTKQISLKLDPSAQNVGDQLRESPPKHIGNVPVIETKDFKSSTLTDAEENVTKLPFPASDVLVFTLENDARVIVRPSGTEPKLKCCYEVVQTIADGASFSEAHAQASANLATLSENHQHSLANFC